MSGPVTRCSQCCNRLPWTSASFSERTKFPGRALLPPWTSWRSDYSNRIPGYTWAMTNWTHWEASTWALMARMVRGLVAFWSDYSRRWQRIRAKVFLRSDLFRRHAGMGTADFAKLAANRAELEWSDAALLAMLVKRIANTSERLAAYCRGARIRFEKDAALGLIPQIREPDDAHPLLERLSGEFMGTGKKKGYVRNWVLAHLRDGNDRVSPRSLVRLIEQAAGKDAANRTLRPPRLIHPTALRQALDDVSNSHVTQGITSEWAVAGRGEGETDAGSTGALDAEGDCRLVRYRLEENVGTP